MQNEADLYQKEWDEYKFRQIIQFAGIFLWILSIIVFAVLSKSLKDIESAFGVNIILIMFVVCSVLSIFGAVYFLIWRCPRCKGLYNYQSGLDIFIKPNIQKKLCVHCELPRYYKSEYFLDYWGSEQANKLKQAENNK